MIASALVRRDRSERSLVKARKTEKRDLTRTSTGLALLIVSFIMSRLGTMPFTYLFVPVEASLFVAWTRPGLFLLIFIFFVSRLNMILLTYPSVPILAFVFAACGTFLVVGGRGAFGENHSNYLVIAVGVYVVAFITGFALDAWLPSRLFSISTNIIGGGYCGGRNILEGYVCGPSVYDITEAYDLFFAGVLIVKALVGAAIILLTFAIQSRLGRLLLVVGYVLSLLINGMGYLLESPAVTNGVSSLSTVRLFVLSSGVYTFQFAVLLDLVSAIITSTAYYMLFARIGKMNIA